MSTIKRHAFRRSNCSECPIRQERLKKIAKVKNDIALLDTFNVPHPKADSELDILNHFQHICNSGECHR